MAVLISIVLMEVHARDTMTIVLHVHVMIIIREIDVNMVRKSIYQGYHLKKKTQAWMSKRAGR